MIKGFYRSLTDARLVSLSLAMASMFNTPIFKRFKINNENINGLDRTALSPAALLKSPDLLQKRHITFTRKVLDSVENTNVTTTTNVPICPDMER
ncbi:hypothetical protein L596_012873 [Steinernema carpocapsae]|uniref:Uncharacterized protein n=1 Tax=Steinernema carpocapsae TaxID=34508 RepID=A0A4U5NYJ5_STECR|nr:hypothetical protein L596_012873 [Steinernema carpocapsae]